MFKLLIKSRVTYSKIYQPITLQVLKASQFSTISHPGLSIDSIVGNFQTKTSEHTTVSEITKTMSEIMSIHISAAELEEYQPIAEELSYYVFKLSQTHKKQTIPFYQAKVMLEFGMMFELQEREYWTLVTDGLLDSFDQQNAADIIHILSQLRQFGLLKNSLVISGISTLKNKIHELTTNELVAFTMIYSSGEAFTAIKKDEKFEEKLDFFLTKHLEMMNPEEFAAICNSVSKTDTIYQSESMEASISLQSVFREAVPQVVSWLDSNEFSVSSIIQVAAAYSFLQNFEGDSKKELFLKLEEAIFVNAKQITVNEAIELIKTVGQHTSPQLIEFLDRIIGQNMYEIPAKEVVPVLQAFLNSGSAREKIISLLLNRVKKHIAQFSTQNICDLVEIFQKREENTGLFELIEPYMLQKVNSLNEEQMLVLLNGFYNPLLHKRFQILDEIEAQIIQHSQSISTQTIADLLFFYGTKRIGDRVVLETLLQRTSAMRLDEVKLLDSDGFRNLILGLNMCGAQPDQIQRLSKLVVTYLPRLTDTDQSLIKQVMSKEGIKL